MTWFTRALGRRQEETDSGRDEVAVGDRFFECGRWENIWVVERIVHPRGIGLPHVVISHARLRSERRLVALSTLLDGTRFSLDGRRPLGRNRTVNRRRLHDVPLATPHMTEDVSEKTRVH